MEKQKHILIGLCLIFSTQCKKGDSGPNTAASPSSSSACLSAQEVRDAFGAFDFNVVDASKIQVSAPTYLVMEFADDQKTLLLQVKAKTVGDYYPDYAKYKIEDVHGKVCVSGQTDSSLTALDIYLPSNCASGVWTITVEGCAASPRLQNPNDPCGPSVSTQYQHFANPKSQLADVLALIQENRKEMTLVSQWLAARSNNFISAVGNSPSLNAQQQIELSLAKLFAAAQADFATIFSSDLYDDLTQAAEANKNSESSGLKLAEGSGFCLAGSDDSNTQGPQTTNGGGETGSTYAGLDVQQILKNAREQYGSTYQGNSSLIGIINAPTSTDFTTTSGAILNNAQKVDMTKNSPLGYIAGGVLIGVGVLWGTAFIAKTVFDTRAELRKNLFFNSNPKLVDADGRSFQRFDSKKVSWVKTSDGQAKIFSYKGRVIQEVRAPDGKISHYEMKELPETGIKDRPWYKRTAQAKAALKKGEITPKASITADVADQKGLVSAKKGAAKPKPTLSEMKSSLKTPSLWHAAGAGLMIGAGIGLLVLTSDAEYKGNRSAQLAEGTGDVFMAYINDLKSAQAAITKLRQESASLEEMQANLVSNSLTK